MTASWPSHWTAPTSRTSARWSRSSTSAPPTVCWPVTACTPPGRTGSVRCCWGCTTTPGCWPASAWWAPSRWPGARSCFEELQELVTGFEQHPWAWAKQEAGTRTPRNAEGSRWSGGKDLSFTPLRPERVVEVKYDHMEGERFRHTTQFVRWRPDRDPRSCTYDQLEEPVKFDLAAVLDGNSPRPRTPGRRSCPVAFRPAPTRPKSPACRVDTPGNRAGNWAGCSGRLSYWPSSRVGTRKVSLAVSAATVAISR